MGRHGNSEKKSQEGIKELLPKWNSLSNIHEKQSKCKKAHSACKTDVLEVVSKWWANLGIFADWFSRF